MSDFFFERKPLIDYCNKTEEIRPATNKKALPSIGERAFEKESVIYFTFFASSVPARNFATFLAGILISVPVCGLRPVRAARLVTVNVPNPTNATRSPFLSALVAELMNASSARDAAALVSFDSLAIALIKSALFMIKDLKGLVKNFLRVVRYVIHYACFSISRIELLT
jgi:hypothetical protein